MGMKTNKIKVYLMAITLVKVIVLLATFMNFWRNILQFIHIPYVLQAQDQGRWRALLNAVVNIWAP